MVCLNGTLLNSVLSRERQMGPDAAAQEEGRQRNQARIAPDQGSVREQ
jgi:hypothetical protein